MSDKSTFLFADPCLIYGVAHLLDFQGTFTQYNLSRTPSEADSKALFADWSSVGESLLDAMNTVEAERQGGKAL